MARGMNRCLVARNRTNITNREPVRRTGIDRYRAHARPLKAVAPARAPLQGARTARIEDARGIIRGANWRRQGRPETPSASSASLKLQVDSPVVVERAPHNPSVGGSSPTRPTTCENVSTGSCTALTQRSIPSGGSLDPCRGVTARRDPPLHRRGQHRRPAGTQPALRPADTPEVKPEVRSLVQPSGFSVIAAAVCWCRCRLLLRTAGGVYRASLPRPL